VSTKPGELHWSTDWFSNKEAALQRVLKAVDDAVRYSDNPELAKREELRQATKAASAAGTSAEPPVRGPRPRVPRSRPIDDYSHQQLVAIASWICSDTLLRTDEELLTEVMDDLGFERRGKKIVAAIEAAIRQARSSR
jgi:hypothetical protein